MQSSHKEEEAKKKRRDQRYERNRQVRDRKAAEYKKKHAELE